MEKFDFEKQFIEDPENPIGRGQDKTVYDRKDNPEQVIAVDRRKASRNEVRARFYLTKILHLLFPNNIPDMSFSYSEPNATAREKVERDSTHLEMQKFVNRSSTDKSKDLERESELSKKFDDANAQMAEKMRSEQLIPDLDKLVSFDSNARNFTYDSDGNLNYLDDFKPWFKGYGALNMAFNVDRLKEKISELSPDEQEKALGYLDRLMILFQVEKDSMNKK